MASQRHFENRPKKERKKERKKEFLIRKDEYIMKQQKISGIYKITCKDYWKENIESIENIINGNPLFGGLLTEKQKEEYKVKLDQMKNNNCIYIGQSVDTNARKRIHKQGKFKGKEFTFEVIMQFDCDDPRLSEKLDYYEVQFINKFNSFENGLNEVRGNNLNKNRKSGQFEI